MRLAPVSSSVVLILLSACSSAGPPRSSGRVVDAGAEPDPWGVPYLWYAGGALSAFTRAQTLATNDDGPAWQVVPDLPVHNTHDLAFDGGGNLWTIPIDGDRIVRLPADRLTALAPVIPDLVLTSPALVGPVGLLFDAAGNLWVLNFNGAGPSVASIVRFDDPRGLTGDQTVSPSLTIKPGPTPDEASRFMQASAIAFDAQGNLWLSAVADVLRLDHAGSLMGGVTAAPSAVLATGEAYGSLAFDGTGSLWVTAAQAGRYFALRFWEPGQLAGAVAPTPVARVRLSVTGATFAGGLAFDGLGGLWIATSAALVKLAHAEDASGEVSTPPAVMLGRVAFPDLTSKVVIRPTPPGLPLFAP